MLLTVRDIKKTGIYQLLHENLKKIGSGTNSIVYELSNETSVLMFTLDASKVDFYNQNRDSKLMPKIYMIEYDMLNRIFIIGMEKLNKLSSLNKKKVINIIDQINSSNKTNDFKKLINKYKGCEYIKDINESSFMENNDGNIILVDPIVSVEIHQKLIEGV